MVKDKTPPADKADDATDDLTEEQLAAVVSDNPETNEEAFEAAFDEFAADDDIADTDAATPPAEGREDKAGTAAPAETTEDTTDDKAASGDEPSDDADDDQPADAAPDGAADAPDIWKDATPEQKAAFEAAEHENKSHKNRASAQNRKISQLMSAPRPAAHPSTKAQEAAAPPATPVTDENWEKFKTEYPDVAGPLAERMDRQDKEIAGLKSENSGLKGQVTGITDAQIQTAINAEEALLAQRHPDWEHLTASADFRAWLPNQPRYVQEGFVRNGSAIIDGEEAATLMDLFKDGRADPAPPEADTKPAKETKDTTNGKASRRSRRMESAVSTESGQAGPGAGPPEGDFDAAFDHFAKQT